MAAALAENKLAVVAEGPIRLIKLLTSARARRAILARAAGLLGGAWSRSMVGAALKDDSVRVLLGGDTEFAAPQKTTILAAGDTVVLDVARIVKRESALRRERAERVIKRIHHEDADVLVFSVEAGVGEKHLGHVVFPELYGQDVARHYRFVSRSYTAVPGLVVVAKHAMAARCLEGAVKMTFRALCAGRVTKDRTIQTLDDDDGGHPEGMPALASSSTHKRFCRPWERFKGKPNTTTVSCIQHFKSNSHGYVSKLDLSHVGPLARHQTRLHLQQIGHPVIGTAIYTRKLKGVSQGACMVMKRVEFHHPTTGDLQCFEVPDPDVFERIVAREARFADARSVKRAKITREFAAGGGHVDRNSSANKSARHARHATSAASASENNDAPDSFLPPPPLAYQLGVQTFMKRTFKVDKRVLIPRPSSSLVVETAVRAFLDGVGRHGRGTSSSASIAPSRKACRILDLGTGSGCLVISVVLELLAQKNTFALTGFGVDLHQEALDVAADNVRAHGLDNVVSLVSGSFDSLPTSVLEPGSFDIIVCNPPYHSARSAHNVLDASVVAHEPHKAMFVAEDQDKLAHYRAVCESCVRHTLLAPVPYDGVLVFEAPPSLIDGVKALMVEHGFVAIAELEDGHGLKRVLSGRLARTV